MLAVVVATIGELSPLFITGGPSMPVVERERRGATKPLVEKIQQTGHYERSQVARGGGQAGRSQGVRTAVWP